jgi:hypothetical protein
VFRMLRMTNHLRKMSRAAAAGSIRAETPRWASVPQCTLSRTDQQRDTPAEILARYRCSDPTG